jgi:hypothetical protein
VDDFGVKYVGRDNAEFLISVLQSLYTITYDWTGALYCAFTLEWDYELRMVHLSMPGYIEKALQRFQTPLPSRAQHSPHAWIAPTYGQPTQYTEPADTSEPLPPAGLTRLQEIIGTLLYYARAVDSTMLVALGSLASAQSKGTQATARAATQLLNYCATHPDAKLCYKASDMVLHVHSDASYLSERQARSRSGVFFYLSSQPTDPNIAPSPTATPPPLNGAILVHSSIMSTVMSSATEAEAGALFYNAKEATVLRNTLNALGHPQPPTPIQTDNACAAGIANDSIRQRRSKAMDMRFYWVRDRVARGEFLVYWRTGTDNLADYFTKHHSPSHHRRMRSRYLVALHKPHFSQGRVDDSGSPDGRHHPKSEKMAVIYTPGQLSEPTPHSVLSAP